MPLKGYKQKKEVIEKRAENLRGKKRPLFSKEWLENMSKSQIGLQAKEKHHSWGKHLSEETKRKISASEKGKIIPLEAREKMGISRLKEKNPAWEGGKSFEKYTLDWDRQLKESIRTRDNHICQECGIHQDELSQNWHKKLDIHHIDYNKQNCNPDNIISLCRDCHTKTNFNREYWVNYFKNNE